MRLEREAERVAANTPHVMSSGTALMYWEEEEEGGGNAHTLFQKVHSTYIYIYIGSQVSMQCVCVCVQGMAHLEVVIVV